MSKGMTREEAIKGLKRLRDDFSGYKPNEEMFDMAIAALETEPCEDAISRQAALDCFTATKMKKFDFILYAREEIKNLPPVQPIRPRGRWIHKNDDRNDWSECSECGYGSDGEVKYGNETPFCPFCGADLRENEG